MKKIIGILSVFLGLGLIICLVLGFVLPVQVSIDSKYLISYKFLCGIEYFLSYFPAITLSGFIVSFSVYFGRNSEGSTNRFSAAMYGRFKIVIISSLICAFLFAMVNETFGIMVSQGKSKIINRPKLINNYIKVGNNLLDNGYYERALRYADAALKLNSNSKEANTLKDSATVEINKAATSNIHFKLYENSIEKETVDHILINAEQISEVYELYQKAQASFDNEEWFNAHYFAELGIKLATPKDPNLNNLKNISNVAWKNISEQHKLKKDDDQLAFDKKYEGYVALHQKDELKAYYIFKELSTTSRQLSVDPDVQFYLNIAEQHIREKYFFIDETFEQKSFENANDVYFSYKYKDGTRDLVYFKGATTVKETGNTIQYLRDLNIISIDANGNVERTMKVPYAKVLPVSVKTLNDTAKELMEIDEKTKSIPYILLNSIGRDNSELKYEPTYTYKDGTVTNSPNYLILPISYEDFVKLESNTKNPEKMSITDLFSIVNKADFFGYSSDVYGQVLINRLLYPLWIVLLLVLVATVAWHNRIGINQFFKLSWVIAFPFIITICWFTYQGVMFIYKLINYVLIDYFGYSNGLIAGIVIYVLLFIIDSLYFVSRNSRQ